MTDPIEDPHMTIDTLDRLRADDIARPDVEPSLADVLTRIDRLQDTTVGTAPRRRRTLVATAAGTGALATALVVVVGAHDDQGLPQLGVLQAAAANSDSDAGRFSGYVRDERTTTSGVPGSPTTTYRNREIIRPVSATEYDGTLQSTQRAYDGPTAPQPRGNQGIDYGEGARVSETRDGDQVTSSVTWRRPYGTIFTGALRRGERPVRVPESPETVRRAIASWADGRAPAGGDPAQADLLREAYGSDDGTQLALGYATDVLTAPRVAADVRAAAFSALSSVPGITIDAQARDPDGRPAASLRSSTAQSGSRSRFELFIDPDRALVLGTRDRSGPTRAEERRPSEPPVSTLVSESTYGYSD